MKQETENNAISAEEFNNTKVSKILASDSDGTLVVPNSDPKIWIPSPELVENIRQKSLEDPEVAIAIISGRTDEYLNEYYSPAFRPDEEGKVPKIMLLAENGAFLRTSKDPETIHTLTEPFTPTVSQEIEDIVRQAAGEYFRESDQNLDPQEISLWLDPKATTYGIFRRTPADEEKRVIMEGILDEIKTGLNQLDQNNDDLHLNLGAVDAFLVEKVSKGQTITDLAAGNLQEIMENAGMETGAIQSMTYHGDDVADIPAQNAVNEMLANGTLASGHTTRENDYAPNYFSAATESKEAEITLLMTKTPPKSPTDAAAQDAFYVLGSKEVSAQEQHQFDFLDQQTIEDRNSLRVDLSNRNLLPSQTGDVETPPIVLLTTGDILIQEPERYQPQTLQNLQDWDRGKVILMANGEDANSLKIKQLGLSDNENIIAVSPEGQVFSKEENLNATDTLVAAKNANPIFSANPQRSAEIQDLRAVQSVLIANGLIQKTQQGEQTAVAIAPATTASEGLEALAATSSEKKKYNKGYKGPHKTPRGPKKAGSWVNHKKRENRKSAKAKI